MHKLIKNTLSELAEQILIFGDALYTSPCKELSNGKIGQHTRHIVELFQCLIQKYDTTYIDYDDRKRDYLIETSTIFADKMIQDILQNIDKENKQLYISIAGNDEKMNVESNYNRELLFNLDHCIHHQALIRIAVECLSDLQLPENFGVSPSTVNYRNTQCVQ